MWGGYKVPASCRVAGSRRLASSLQVPHAHQALPHQPITQYQEIHSCIASSTTVSRCAAMAAAAGVDGDAGKRAWTWAWKGPRHNTTGGGCRGQPHTGRTTARPPHQTIRQGDTLCIYQYRYNPSCVSLNTRQDTRYDFAPMAPCPLPTPYLPPLRSRQVVGLAEEEAVIDRGCVPRSLAALEDQLAWLM